MHNKVFTKKAPWLMGLFILACFLAPTVLGQSAGDIFTSFSPKDLSSTSQSSLMLKGKVRPNIRALKINGKSIELAKDGAFSAQAVLKTTGKYVFNLAAIDKSSQSLAAKIMLKRVAAFKDLNLDNNTDRKIIELASTGIVSGYPDKTFRPDNKITRAEAASIIAKAKGYTFSTPSQALRKLINAGIMSPVSGQDPRPSKWINRAEAVKIAVKLNDQIARKNIKNPPFIDVPLSHWSVSYIDVANKLGWLKALVPKTSLKFQPLIPITRKEMLLLLSQTKLFAMKLQEFNNWDYTKDIQIAKVFPLSSKKTISMDFSNVDIRTVLKTFSKETGMNVVIGKNVKGKVSAHFKNVEPMTALNGILNSSEYTYVLEGDNLLRIIPGKNFRTKSSGKYIKTFIIDYADINKLAGEVVKLVPTLKGKVLIGDSSNSLIIDGGHPQINKITEIIERLDAPPLQVMVEAQIFELSLDDKDKFGTNIISEQSNRSDSGRIQTYGFAQNDPDSDPDFQGMFVKVIGGDTTAFFNALRSRSDFELLSSPKIMAINNQEASLSTGEEVGYPDETTTYSTTGPVISKTIKFATAATELKFTPHISDDGFIMIDLTPVISEVSLSTDDIPTIKTTEAHTQVVVADGETFIIGGLIKDKLENVEHKVPLLGDLPWIGNLFKSTELIKRKRHITVMITPHIIDSFHVEEMGSEINSVRDSHYKFREKKEGTKFQN